METPHLTSTRRSRWPALLLASLLGAATGFAQAGTTSTQAGSTGQPRTSGAAQGADQQRSSSTTRQTAEGLSSDARDFVRDAARTNYAEVALSQLAVDKAQDQQVRRFAEQVVSDHRKASDQMKQLAQRRGIEIEVAGSGTLKNPASPAEAGQASAAGRADDNTVSSPGAPIPDDQEDGYGYFSGIGAPVDDEEREGQITLEQYRSLSEASGREFDEQYVELMVDSHEMAIDRFEEASEELDDPELRSFARQQLPTLRQHLQHAQQLESAVAE